MKAYLLHLILRFSPKLSKSDLSKLMAKLPDSAHRVLHERDPDENLRSVAVIFLSEKPTAKAAIYGLESELAKFRDWNVIEVSANVAAKHASASPLQHWLNVFYAQLQRQESPPAQKSETFSGEVVRRKRRGPTPHRRYND